MSRHSHYPPVIPTVYRRPLSAVTRFFLSGLLGIVLIASVVLGTAWLINWIEAIKAAPEVAFQQGFRAGAQTCEVRR